MVRRMTDAVKLAEDRIKLHEMAQKYRYEATKEFSQEIGLKISFKDNGPVVERALLEAKKTLEWYRDADYDVEVGDKVYGPKVDDDYHTCDCEILDDGGQAASDCLAKITGK